MVDIQPAAAEIRRGKKKKEDRKKETTGQKYNGPPITYGGHKKPAPIISKSNCGKMKVAVIMLRKHHNRFMALLPGPPG